MVKFYENTNKKGGGFWCWEKLFLAEFIFEIFHLKLTEFFFECIIKLGRELAPTKDLESG